MLSCRRLLLEGLDNARDLGGFLTNENKTTKFNQYIRCEEMSTLTENDIIFLKEYGIQHCIDLRSHKQIEKTPSPLNDIPGIVYHVVDADTSFSERNEKTMHVDLFTPKTWSDILFGMLDEQSVWMGKAIQLLANCNGGVIFNCNSGRNRSNLMALIILAIAKVPFEDIIAEYSTNAYYLQKAYSKWYPEGSHPSGFYETPPFVLEDVIQRILEKYDSFEKYLLACNVTRDDISKIYHHIV